MNIDIRDIITLDDNNEYVVVSKANYNNEAYFYIFDINNKESFKILKLNKENNKLIEFEDQDLVKNLIPLFFNEAKDLMDSIIPSIE